MTGATADIPLRVEELGKSFTMHLRDGLAIPVLSGASFDLRAGACTVLGGPSGIGKSSILKMVFGNYRLGSGRIRAWHQGRSVELAGCPPRLMLEVRRHTIGYVSQFLRVVPRVSALDIVAEPLAAAGMGPEEARGRAAALFERLNLPEKLWSLPPATFSGGEQQRVNIARGFITAHPILLLDEPTASLDAKNRAAVVEMIREKKRSGTAILGIFHDPEVRRAVADETIDVTRFAPRAATDRRASVGP